MMGRMRPPTAGTLVISAALWAPLIWWVFA